MNRKQACHMALFFSCIAMLVCMISSCAKKNTQEIDAADTRNESSRIATAKKNAALVGASKKLVETWKRSRITANTSRLMIGETDDLPLKAIQINVHIDGFRARVVMDAFYFNDRNRQYEGTFKLRLPEGANPYFFAFGDMILTADAVPQQSLFMSAAKSVRQGALPEEIMAARKDVWSAPKEARMVPKEKAVYTYMGTVSRRLDPALMEWAGPGIFSCRVFPLRPKKMHRIVIGYDVDLIPTGNEFQYLLDLPRHVPQTLIDIVVADVPNTTISVTPAVPVVHVAANDGAPAKCHYRFDRPISSTIKVKVHYPGTLLLVGNDRQTGDYVATGLRPVIPVTKPLSEENAAIFMVDVSLSSNPDRFNTYLKLLAAILNNNRDTIRKFAVLFFNIESFWYREAFIENTPVHVSALLQYADTLALEGATDIGEALRNASQPAWLSSDTKTNSWDLFLLSDGSITWGEEELYALSEVLHSGKGNTLFSYRTGLSGTDMAVLHHLARESGGAVFSVVGESEIAKAATAHRSRPWMIMGIGLDGCHDVLVAGRPKTLFPGQFLRLAGRGTPASQARLKIYLEQDGEKKTLVYTIDGQILSPLAQRAYGRIAVGQLESFGVAADDVSKAYATHFRITGKTDSLLMLESEAEYQRFNIQPESNAYIVTNEPVNDFIALLIKDAGDVLGNPKDRFMAWLKTLSNKPGVAVELPRALNVAIEKIPSHAFGVSTKPIIASHHSRAGIPETIQHQLTAKKPDYDAIYTEAKRRRDRYGSADYLRALSSLVESSPADTVMTRDVAYSIANIGYPGHAYRLFYKTSRLRPYEPQSYRDMAKVLEKSGRADLALLYYEIGLNGEWPVRFGDFELIVGLDYLRFLRQVVTGKLQVNIADYAKVRLDSIASRFDLGKADMIVTITWNTDNTDVDLHVREPTGETCSFKNTRTRIGGIITRDVTSGFGPEMYVLKNAVKGTYTIKVKYYSIETNRLSTRTKVSATITQGWGTDHEHITEKTVALMTETDMHDIMRVSIN